MNKKVKSIISTIVFFAFILTGLVLCVAVPDEDDKAKDYDYENPENN